MKQRRPKLNRNFPFSYIKKSLIIQPRIQLRIQLVIWAGIHHSLYLRIQLRKYEQLTIPLRIYHRLQLVNIPPSIAQSIAYSIAQNISQSVAHNTAHFIRAAHNTAQNISQVIACKYTSEYSTEYSLQYSSEYITVQLIIQLIIHEQLTVQLRIYHRLELVNTPPSIAQSIAYSIAQNISQSVAHNTAHNIRVAQSIAQNIAHNTPQNTAQNVTYNTQCHAHSSSKHINFNIRFTLVITNVLTVPSIQCSQAKCTLKQHDIVNTQLRRCFILLRSETCRAAPESASSDEIKFRSISYCLGSKKIKIKRNRPLRKSLMPGPWRLEENPGTRHIAEDRCLTQPP